MNYQKINQLLSGLRDKGEAIFKRIHQNQDQEYENFRKFQKTKMCVQILNLQIWMEDQNFTPQQHRIAHQILTNLKSFRQIKIEQQRAEKESQREQRAAISKQLQIIKQKAQSQKKINIDEAEKPTKMPKSIFDKLHQKISKIKIWHAQEYTKQLKQE